MPTPAPSSSPPSSPSTEEVITLGGGCFWCLDAVFNEVRGVVGVESGYSNGRHPRPTYEAVCQGDTGHAEVVQVRFDPGQIDLRTVLSIFFAIHDPTSLNRQGNDVGTQYRSGIYTHRDEQADVARQVMADLASQQVFDRPLVTELMPVANYHPAEAYHQRYFEKNPGQGYCAFVVAPKVSKFRQQFAQWMRG